MSQVLSKNSGRVRSVEKRGGEGAGWSSKRAPSWKKTGKVIPLPFNGVCMTAHDVLRGFFPADGSRETLQRSTLAGLRSGSVVNLERAVTPSTRSAATSFRDT